MAETGGGGGGGDAADDAESGALQVLLNDYYIAREEEHAFQTVVTTLMSVAVALIGAIVVFIYNSCDLSRSKDCIHVQPWVYAALPLGPLVILSYLGVVANTATVRSYYMRALERELHELGGRHTTILEPDAQPLLFPSFVHLIHPIVSQRRGLARYRFLAFTFYVAMGGLFFGLACTSLYLAGNLLWQVGAGLFYLTGTGVYLTVLWSGTVGGRELWWRLLERLPRMWAADLATEPVNVRGLWSYLLLPRADAVVKWLFLPLAALLASWTRQVSLNLGYLALFTIGFEYFVYQNRYVWNDLLDLVADARDPMRDSRNRFPQPVTQFSVVMTLIAAAVRFAGWIAVVRVLWHGPLGPALLWSGVAVLVISVPYEVARRRVAAETTDGASLVAATLAKRAVYLLVGLGYALRAAVGLWVGSAGAVGWWPLLAAVLAMRSFGTMFVTMTWVVVGTTFVDATGRVWPSHIAAEALVDRGHYGPLLRTSRIIATPLTIAPTVRSSRKRPPLLARNRWSSFWSRWNIVWNRNFITAAGLVAVLDAFLAERLEATVPPWAAAITAALGVCFAASASLLHGRQHRRFALYLLLTLTLSIVVLLLAQDVPDLLNAAVSMVPLAGVGGLYWFFRSATAADIARFQAWPKALRQRAGKLLWKVAISVMRLALGPTVTKVFLGRAAVTARATGSGAASTEAKYPQERRRAIGDDGLHTGSPLRRHGHGGR